MGLRNLGYLLMLAEMARQTAIAATLAKPSAPSLGKLGNTAPFARFFVGRAHIPQARLGHLPLQE
ncbi:MAG: hypothetical protein Fur0042_05580 [Cyanophyceae cyanobacterium]